MRMNEPDRAKAIYIVLLFCSLIWLGFIFFTPWLMAERHLTASMIIYQGFSAVCHQQLERSFHLFGFPLGVCSRCTGIYAGFVMGLFLYPTIRSLSIEIFPARKWLIIASIPLLIDFAGGFAGLFTNSLFSRTATGFILGAALAFYILPGFVSAFCLWNARKASTDV